MPSLSPGGGSGVRRGPTLPGPGCRTLPRVRGSCCRRSRRGGCPCGAGRRPATAQIYHWEGANGTVSWGSPLLPPLCLETSPATSWGTSHLLIPRALLLRMHTQGLSKKGTSSHPWGCHPAPRQAPWQRGQGQGEGQCCWTQPPPVFLGSNHGHVPRPSSAGQPGLRSWPDSLWGWGPRGLMKLPLQLLPAPTDHQQVHIPFHKEVVPARPPEHLCGHNSQTGLWAEAQHPHPHPCPVRDGWGLLSKAGSARPPCVPGRPGPGCGHRTCQQSPRGQ